MKAVILAAGSARRLSPLADNTHKCLLEVGEKGILEHQLDALDRYGVAEALIVVGFLKEQIQGRFGNQYRNMSLTYIENPDYATTNTV
nr:NTP transferase domain-containing protein [Bacteroidota bacterium]